MSEANPSDRLTDHVMNGQHPPQPEADEEDGEETPPDSEEVSFYIDPYENGDDIAAVVTVEVEGDGEDDVQVVLGYAEEIEIWAREGDLRPAHYVDIAPDAPAPYVNLMRDLDAEIHDHEELDGRLNLDDDDLPATLYPDGFSVVDGVGIIPTGSDHTVVVQDTRSEEPVSVLFSNARDEEVGDDV